MPQLGRKYTCYSCHTKFYDLGKPTPLCPKCGADQRDAEETPLVTSGRGRAARIVEEPAEEPEFQDAEPGTAAAETDEEEDAGAFPDAEREEEPEEEEEEDY
ncbi:MAG TPA: FYDLN acid domain-containing protein [Thermoanaerobaculia bacterium]|nr:FYDLN acid domain-containing protein [Thermoanaerobaculia bacterium]